MANTSALLNCTCSAESGVNLTACGCCYMFYPETSIYIMGFASLGVICFGLIANIISAIIFSTKVMRRHSINWYLTARSVTDFLLLVTSLLIFVLPRLECHRSIWNSSPFLGQYCKGYLAVNISHFTTPVTYAMALITQTASIYLTVLMTAHRFIGVCFPFKVHSILSNGRVKAALITVLSSSLLFNITKFFEVTLSDFCLAPNIRTRIYEIIQTPIRSDETYKTIFYGWFSTIFKFIIPFLALIIMNSKVIQAVHSTRKLHANLHDSTDDAARRIELKREINTSVLLVGVVLIFLICNALTLVLNVLEVAGFHSSIPAYTLLVDVSNLLVALSCSCNIFVYCAFSYKFRVIFWHYCCCGCFREEEMLFSTAV